jgi:hypothetical protein
MERQLPNLPSGHDAEKWRQSDEKEKVEAIHRSGLG